MPNYVGVQPSKFDQKYSYFDEYVKNNYKSFKLIIGKNINDYYKTINNYRVIVSGSYDSSNLHLKEYLKNDSTKTTCEDILEFIKNTDINNWFNSPVVSLPTDEDIIHQTKVNIKSNSGLYTSKLIGNTKGETLPFSIPSSLQLYNIIKKKFTKNTYLWTIGGREKDTKNIFTKDEKELSSRMVLYTEAPASILLCNIAQRIQHAINRDDTNKYKFHLDKKFTGNKSRYLEDKREKFDFELEADWTFFDSNVDSEYIKAASLILLCGLNDGSKESIKLIYYIFKSIKTKNVVIPPNVVIEVNRAVPSGHPFTSLINNFINLIYWCQIGYKIYGKNYQNYMHLETYGDDANVFFKSHVNLYRIDEYTSELGLKSDKLVNKLKPIKPGIHNQIDFLKRYYNNYMISWNYNKMFDRLIYQTKHRSIQDQVEQLFSYLITTPEDETLQKIFIEFVHYILIKYKTKLNTESIFKINKLLEVCENIENIV